MFLSDPIVTVLRHFESAFSQPTWRHVQVLVVGTVLARGRRTVSSALRQMGMASAEDFSIYHQVLNRACWSPLELSRRLLLLLVRLFVRTNGALTFVVDETLERRWGRRISLRGHYRDPLASSKQRAVAVSGVRWVVMTLIITPPWTQRSWALPVMSVPAPTPAVSRRLGRRHKTVPQLARQMMLILRRFLPHAEMTILGDQTYSVAELGRECARHQVRLIAPLRLDARLYEPAPPRQPGVTGRPRLKGERLPKLSEVLQSEQTAWSRLRVRWYDGRQRSLEITSGCAQWYRIGQPVLAIRWVIVRDPLGKLSPRAYFSTRQTDVPRHIVVAFIKRWTIETTFEEARAHLGIETQRQWSDKAIQRETPCLLGLYSVVTVLAQALYPAGDVPVQATAWYRKRQPTFADVLACVRRHLWGEFNYSTSARDPDLLEIPRCEMNRLAQAVCCSH